MTVALLTPSVVAQLVAEPLTYAEVGATAGRLPDGYHHTRARRVVDRGGGPDGGALTSLADRLLSWRVHELAGFAVAASDARVVAGAVVVLRRRVGPLTIRAACRVVSVVDEPDRCGFTYGTLPGHPESGEESFAVERDADGSLVATVVAFSRPAARLARLAGPVGRRLQARATVRYLDALTP